MKEEARSSTGVYQHSYIEVIGAMLVYTSGGSGPAFQIGDQVLRGHAAALCRTDIALGPQTLPNWPREDPLMKDEHAVAYSQPGGYIPSTLPAAHGVWEVHMAR